ncbi:MAG: hypothetical protein ACJATE_001921 [Bacteroidia bacterium]|jgi:hypothetical protein
MQKKKVRFMGAPLTNKPDSDDLKRKPKTSFKFFQPAED